MTDRQIKVIKFVRDNGPCLIADIASHLKDEVSVARSAVRRLVDQGYLKKKSIFGIADQTLGMGQRYHTQRFLEISIGDRKLDD